jgi:hypothetical protein
VKPADPRPRSPIRVPRALLALGCALVLLPPAAIALGHSLWIVNGEWFHHHTTQFTTCNSVGNSRLHDNAGDARQTWDDKWDPSTTTLQSDIDLPLQTECHPAPPGVKAQIEIRDGHFGDVGWKASSINNTNSNYNATFHSTHTHIQFNLDSGVTGLSNYDQQTLACREIGQVLGLARVTEEQWAAEADDNDCMSAVAISQQVSKQDNPDDYTYTNKPGPHSTALLDSTYGPIITLSIDGEPVTEGGLQSGKDYDLQVTAEGHGVESLDFSLPGYSPVHVGQTCPETEITCTVSGTLTVNLTQSGKHVLTATANNDFNAPNTDMLDLWVDSPTYYGFNQDWFARVPEPQNPSQDAYQLAKDAGSNVARETIRWDRLRLTDSQGDTCAREAMGNSGRWSSQGYDRAYRELTGSTACNTTDELGPGDIAPVIVVSGAAAEYEDSSASHCIVDVPVVDDSDDANNAWQAFVRNVAQRYPLAAGIEVWNEENASTHWGGCPADPVRYTELLQRAYDAVKAVDPNMKVVTGGLATGGQLRIWTTSFIQVRTATRQATTATQSAFIPTSRTMTATRTRRLGTLRRHGLARRRKCSAVQRLSRSGSPRSGCRRLLT